MKSMKKIGTIFYGVFLWAIILCLQATNLKAYSYGPACQWIHLEGQVIAPASVEPPYLLTVTYQFPNMKNPGVLLSNQRLEKPEFTFYFSGFQEKRNDIHFVSPMFFFAKEILFTYSARSLDGKWRSPNYRTLWTPTPVPVLYTSSTRKNQYRCHTKVQLDPMILEKRPLRGVRGL